MSPLRMLCRPLSVILLVLFPSLLPAQGELAVWGTSAAEAEQAEKMLRETDEQGEEAVAAVPPINPEELKALSELARKLA